MADVLSPLLAFGAGALTILSPCVLPLVPIVLGSAAQRHRFGPLALATGLVVSFTLVGFVVAAFGSTIGLDSEAIRVFGAVLLVLAGVFLIVPAAQALLTRATTPLAGWANARQVGLERFGLGGQAAIGVLLGLVWSPCIGPTLGAATALAAQGENLGQVFFVMLAFGLGIAAVLLAIALTTRSFLTRWRGRLMSAGGSGKRALGVLLLVVGAMIFTGLDRVLEGILVSASPEWLTDLTTMI
jgi:cytochrome c-type biogenesis protein